MPDHEVINKLAIRSVERGVSPKCTMTELFCKRVNGQLSNFVVSPVPPVPTTSRQTLERPLAVDRLSGSGGDRGTCKSVINAAPL